MSHPAEQVQQQVSEMSRAYWQEQYQAYQQGREIGRSPFFSAHPMDAPIPSWPTTVDAAYQFYQDHLTRWDRGSASIAHASIHGKGLYIIQARTDGDDGWIELYDEAGACLGVGRTYIELIAWGDPETLRGQVDTGEFPANLDRRQTFWKS